MAWAPQQLRAFLLARQMEIDTALPGSQTPLLRTRISVAGDVLVFIRPESLGALHPEVIAAHRQAVNDAVTDLRDTVARLGWASLGVFGVLGVLLGSGAWANGFDIRGAIALAIAPLGAALFSAVRSWLMGMLFWLVRRRLFGR
jgi:hypothetical protein